MDDDDMRSMFGELTAMRVILVNILSSMPEGQLRAVSEGVDSSFSELFGDADIETEAALAPLRESVDAIFLAAAKPRTRS